MKMDRLSPLARDVKAGQKKSLRREFLKQLKRGDTDIAALQVAFMMGAVYVVAEHCAKKGIAGYDARDVLVSVLTELSHYRAQEGPENV